MDTTKTQQPRNIFEQILFGQLAVNDNIVALAKNVEILNERFDDIMTVFMAHTEVLPEDKHEGVKQEETVLQTI
jgi:hypothetical protein